MTGKLRGTVRATDRDREATTGRQTRGHNTKTEERDEEKYKTVETGRAVVYVCTCVSLRTCGNE